MNRSQIVHIVDKHGINDCHLQGTTSLTLDELTDYVVQFTKDTELILYCNHKKCPLTHKAWGILKALGYTNVAVYEEGADKWIQAGLPVTGKCELHNMPEERTITRDPAIKNISLEYLQDKYRKQ